MDNNVVAKHILDVAVGLEKKSKNELITELSDIFNNASKIDLNSKENINSLKNLAKAFEAIFSKAGNKSINFEDIIKMPPPAMFAEMGKIAATSFWDAWNSVNKTIGGNATQKMMREQFKQLEKQKADLIKRQKMLPEKQREYETLSRVVDDMPYMEENEFKAYAKEEIKKMGGNIEKIAADMQAALEDALDNLSAVDLDNPRFDAVLEDTLKKAEKVFRMSRTLENRPDLIKNKSLLDYYDFTNLQETYGDVLNDEMGENSTRMAGLVRQIDVELSSVSSKLKEIDNEIVQIKNSGIEIVDQASAKDGLKTLEEIREAYKSILTQNKRHSQRPDKVKIDQIQSALDWEPSEDKGAPQIQTLFDQYQNAAATGDWIKEYEALLKYVRLYEKYLQSENKTHRNKITRPDNPFTPLYEQLKPMADNARNMLQNIINMSEGKELVGMGGTGKDQASDGPTPEDVANAQKIREEAEIKAKAEKEAREEAEKRLLIEKQQEESLKKQRIEQEKIAQAAEKEQIAKEAAAKTSAVNLPVNLDEDDDITKENSVFEDRLERLQEIAGQYGINITQKERDRYEELNQKDMDEGLTSREEERYWELSEQVEEADQALEEFGQTYDKIIVKLENGKNVEILPDDKGLRTLAKIDDEYGESYNGVEISDIIFERTKQEAVATEQAVDGLNESLKETQQLISVGGAGDASSADLEAEKAKSESLQKELEQKTDTLNAVNEEKKTLQNDLDVINKQNAELREQISNDGDALWTAEQRANEAEERAAQLEKRLSKSFDGDKSQGALNTEELKTLLSSIVYNVKIAYDDADKKANKIALDESALEATLNKVFTNILNPQTQSNDSEQKQEPWAFEKTLQTVKGVLDNINTNTGNIGTIKTPNVDTIAGTALDGRLTEIKSVLESIDSKIAKGGVIATRGAVKQANAQPIESEAKAQAARSNMMKSLINDYKTLGKLSAQFASDNNLETKAMLENLKNEITRKRQSLKLSMDENVSLREKYSIAFDAEKRLLDAAKAQKEIDAKNKANAKETESACKKQVKDAQRATGINAANNAANTGDQTVLRAIGAEGISKDIENKAKELSSQIKTLRMLRDEIDKKGNQASDADRDNLSKQIAKVKELKAEVDGYLKIHEKYSGEGVTQFNDVDTSNFGAVGTDKYWNNITAAIQKALTGRVTIKGMNADTGELTGTTKIAANTFAQWSAVVDPMTGKLSMLRTGIKKTETLVESITRKTKEIFTYFSGSSIIFKAVNEIKKGVQYIRDIDLALTELKKVTDETEASYDKFLKTAAKTGEKFGSTISAVTEATATFAKLGYTMQQSMEMAEAAIVYKNVGDNIASTEDAADSIISTLKGFGLEASEAMDIVDKFNEVGNRFAITSQGIGEALRLSASALNEGGNSLDESIALITAANEVVNDPSSVGTALKTLTLRLRGSKTELEEMGEDVTGMATTTSQLQAKLLALTGGKVDIMLDENTFKNSTQILREMAAAWEDMNDIQRASALELMGGKRQANVLSALIQNFDTVESAIEASANSSGSALKENERYLDSIQGKIDQFNNAVQTLWSNTLDSDVIKFLIDLATKIIKIVDAIDPLNIAIVGLVAFLEKKHNVFSNFFKPAGSDAQELADQIDESFDAAKVKKQISGKKGAITKRAKQLESEGKTFTEIQEDPKIKQWTQEVKDGEQAIDEYNASIQRADATLRQSNATTTQATATERAHTAAETASVGATNASAAAEAADTSVTTQHTAATWADVLAESNREGATIRSTAATANQVLATKLANSTLIQNAIALGLATQAEVANMTVTQLLGLGFKGLAVSVWSATKAIAAFLFTNPIGWIILAVTAVTGAVAAFLKWGNTAENLREKLSNIKSEISSVKNEIQSLNGELETTQDRMAELLAKDSLTFTEKEELDNLKKQNDELEREIDMLERREAILQRQAESTFDALMGKKKYLGRTDSDGEVYDKSLNRKIRKADKWSNKYDAAELRLLEAEESGNGWKQFWAKLNYNIASTKKNNTQAKLDKELNEYYTAAAGVDYDTADEQTRKYLDYIDNMEGRLNIQAGGDQAKTHEIKRIFNKSTMDEARKEIDNLVEQLAKNPGDQTIITQISKQCQLAQKDLKAVGLSVQDATDYFTKLGTTASYNTIDGKIKEIDEAAKRFKSALNDVDTSTTDSIKQALTSKGWVDKDGKVLSDEIAEYFGGEDGGVSEETRKEIERLVKQIYDGKISVQDALKSFELFGVQSVIEIQVEEVKTNFKDVFVDLGDADGLINTFEELGSAISSTVGALEAFNQAQADVADKGFVSIQTALQLMEYTDDYSSVLQVVNGKLQLTENAEENLIQARIKAIKVSAQTAVADAQAAYDKAQLAVTSYRSAMVEEASASVVATAWQKIVAVAAGIKNALENIWSGQSISELYNSGYNTYLERATGYKTEYDDAGLQALEDELAASKTALDEAKGNAEITNILTEDNLYDVFNPSENKTPEEVKKDKLDELMEDFQRDMEYWENLIGANQSKYEQLQNEIDLLEAKGQKAGREYYDEQIELEKEREILLSNQKEAAREYLYTLEEGSEEWWEVANTLNDLENEIDDVTSSILDLQDAIGEIDDYKFDEFNKRLNNLTNKLETIRSLIAPNDEEDWFDDEGNWTDKGVGVLGTYINDLEFFKQGYQNTIDELAKYESPYANNESYYKGLGIHSEQEYYDKVEELTDSQYQFAESINDTKQSIVDMYESSIDAVGEYIDTLVDGYNDYIDRVKEALDAERDLYDFKKNVQKQAKDISELERRIASLSGSTNAADIAERRKLEAQLYESRESLNDTYYDHARESQQNALDAEAEAYEEQMNKFVEGLRTSLAEATSNMDEFLMGVTTMVMYNADIVLAKYEETNLPLTKELTNPWEEAKKATDSYSGNALDLMNQWTKEGGFFTQFNEIGTKNLQSPWSAGTTAVTNFKTDVGKVMSDIVTNISSNVETASGELSSLYQQIVETKRETSDAGVKIGGNTVDPVSVVGGLISSAATAVGSKTVDSRILSKYKLNATQVLALGYGPISLEKFEDLLRNYRIKYSPAYKQVANTRDVERSLKEVLYGEYVSGPLAIRQYAKGTTGTKRGEWAITDEPQFGDELVLVPGKDGNLSFMRKGTSVVPADLTANLMEWGQFSPDAMNFGGGVDVNMINNVVNKPEINFAFDALVRADNITEETLPAVKKLVTQELNRFTKELNYALKGKGAR